MTLGFKALNMNSPFRDKYSGMQTNFPMPENEVPFLYLLEKLMVQETNK